ncbi:MAG: hypothetical protein JW973_01630 [Bacteroidales bacterium]|nr:hypothetical protein [Bacteroidales bacterium]
MKTMKDEITRLAGRFNCGIWDFYTKMGGLNSVSTWYSHGLMKHDKVHFTKEGYMLKDNLLFEAFIKSQEKSLDESITQ